MNFRAGIRKAGRRLNRRLVQILSWLALPVLVVELVRSYRDPSSQPYHQLILVGLILGFAILAQSGNDLLARIKKVGPVEFAERRFERIVSVIEAVPDFDLSSRTRLYDLLSHAPLDLPSGTDEPFSKRFLYEYEKTDLYVTHLEWSGLGETAQSENFHDLLFKMSAVALYRGDWIRALDRLELLLRISGGKFKPAEAHYRCGLAYSYLAQTSQGRDREDGFLQARDHFRNAVKEDPHHWPAFFNLAYVQVDLKMYDLARQNNEKAIEIRPDYAPAKYNLAICYIKLGDLDTALEKVTSIKPEDQNAETVIAVASTDEELQPLLRDEQRGPEAKRFLRAFNNRKS